MTTSELTNSLGVIETGMRRLGRHVTLEAFQPGVPAEAVRATLREVGLSPSPELEALYAWRNGMSPDIVKLGDMYLFPGFYLASLDEAVTNYRAFVDDARWTPGWWPLFADGGGDFYVVDLGPRSDRSVRLFWIDQPEQPVEFGSLTAMARTVAAAYERGVYFVDSDGYLEVDYRVFGELAAELNPDVEWWRS